MKTMGLVISHKNEEGRRALLPKQVKSIKNANNLYFEKGYGDAIGVRDEEYIEAGANVVSRDQALNCDIITDVKLGDGDYFERLDSSKILFGWAHAVQNIEFATKAINDKHTVIAWEEIFENGRYFLYRNREVAGEAAILHAFRYSKKMPYDAKVAIVGNGQTAKGAMRVLHGLGADIDIYPRKMEKPFLRNKFNYDVIVNCVMWDTSRDDRLIYKEDLKKMKPGTLIIDVSCDPHLEIETSKPTTIDDPVYEIDGVIHYAVDNTPGMFPVTVTKEISKNVAKYIDCLLESDFSDIPQALKNAIVIENGIVRDERITAFREKHIGVAL